VSSRAFRIVKRGVRIKALLEGGQDGRFEFRPAQEYEPIEPERVFAVDSESLTAGGQLRTLLTTLRFHDSDKAIETPDGRDMLEKLCATVCARFGIKAGHPSDTKQRPRRRRPGSRRSRDGRKKTIPPVLSVWFNLAYDFGRLASDRHEVLRSVLAGADSYRVRISARYELEVSRMNFGSSSSFEWFIRDLHEKTIVRLLGIDLTGYWKTSLASAAKALGIVEKVDLEKMFGTKPEEFFRRHRESFSAEEWRLFRDEYALGDVETTLELYHRTVDLLRTVDARVVRRTGVIPPSAPGAAARIVFAGAFDAHPELRKECGGPGCWERAPQWADQMGCDSYFGGNVFSTAPGVHSRMISLDIKSAYPYALACLPDPVTARYEYIKERNGFDVREWRGLFGVLYIDGEGLDDLHPPFRQHDAERKRLRYVSGVFEDRAVTIPEIVMGVLSGALRVDRIRRGVVMHGAPEKSFLRSGMVKFFGIKNDPTREKPLRDMAKLLANATYGKLVEVNASDYSLAEDLPIPRFLEGAKVASTLARIYAENGADELGPDDYAGEGIQQADQVRRIFAENMRGLPEEDRGGNAILAYVDALRAAGVEASKELVSVGDFMRANTRYRCGQYFMPLCASLVTGLTSATVRLLARCLGALQGDTDSVHVVLPEGAACRADQPASELGLPGWDRFERLLADAGYGQRVPEVPELGQWFCESPGPSVESVLARPKVYSHLFADGSLKQAKHGFSKWPDSKRELHTMLRHFTLKGSATYTTKPAPRKLRAAGLTDQQVGEFIANEVTLVLAPDPNTWRDEHGNVRWLDFDGYRLARAGPLAAE